MRKSNWICRAPEPLLYCYIDTNTLNVLTRFVGVRPETTLA
jgi:hypothetical protein